MDFTGKTVLVTGASKGIGATTAQAFLEAGAQVALVARDGDALATLAEPHGGRALALPCDVSGPDQVTALFERLRTAWDRLDILFNNAGAGAPMAAFGDTGWADWRRVMGVNLDGAFLVARGAFAWMRDQRPQGGRIINNGSISAHAPRPGSAAYTASKHAVTGLTKCIALDGRPHDIACGQIDIGNAATEMTERMAEGVAQPDGSVRPEPRMPVQEVARAVLHMASLPPEANVQFMTVMATRMPWIGRG